MQKFTYEAIMTNNKIQKEFLDGIDLSIKLAKRDGHIQQATILARNKKMLLEEIELLGGV